MATLSQSRKDIEMLANGLRALGWTPTIGTLNVDFKVRNHSIGVIVPVGDDRFKWEAEARNPMMDFFSISNIANDVTTTMSKKPVGFNWSYAGTGAVEIRPNKHEPLLKFVERLKAISRPINELAKNLQQVQAPQAVVTPAVSATAVIVPAKPIEAPVQHVAAAPAPQAAATPVPQAPVAAAPTPVTQVIAVTSKDTVEAPASTPVIREVAAEVDLAKKPQKKSHQDIAQLGFDFNFEEEAQPARRAAMSPR